MFCVEEKGKGKGDKVYCLVDISFFFQVVEQMERRGMEMLVTVGCCFLSEGCG